MSYAQKKTAIKQVDHLIVLTSVVCYQMIENLFARILEFYSFRDLKNFEIDRQMLFFIEASLKLLLCNFTCRIHPIAAISEGLKLIME